MPDQALIGLVLPRSFVDGTDYKKEREMILNNFELISLTGLPDRIFLHSDMETAIIVARKHQPRRKGSVVYMEVKDHERETFRSRHQVTWEDKVPQSYFEDKTQGKLIVPLLREVWERLEGCIPLGKIADISIGVQYKPNLEDEELREIVRLKPFSGSKPGIYNVTEGFKQFKADNTVYMSTEKKYRRFESSKAWDLPWDKSKIIVPASRMSRGAWRFSAAMDKDGLIASRRFYCIWPKSEDFTVEILAALLNSPLAEAFVYSHSFQRDITKHVYSSIPVPNISFDAWHIIHSLVSHYLESIKVNDKDKAKKTLLQIDAEVLKLYNLPPRLERKLLDIFWGKQRPVPFEFTGYIPLEIDSWIPLHIYISKRLGESTLERIFKRVPIIHDAEFVSYLKSIGMEE